jgi:hypothetical protein
MYLTVQIHQKQCVNLIAANSNQDNYYKLKTINK